MFDTIELPNKDSSISGELHKNTKLVLVSTKLAKSNDSLAEELLKCLIKS